MPLQRLKAHTLEHMTWLCRLCREDSEHNRQQNRHVPGYSLGAHLSGIEGVLHAQLLLLELCLCLGTHLQQQKSQGLCAMPKCRLCLYKRLWPMTASKTLCRLLPASFPTQKGILEVSVEKQPFYSSQALRMTLPQHHFCGGNVKFRTIPG